MGFFDIYGTPSSAGTSSKSKTAKELIKDALNAQRKLLAGKPVYNGKSKVKSWFNGEKFSPKAGQFTLFDKKSVNVGNADSAKVLDDFEKALDAGEFDQFIRGVEAKRNSGK